MKKIIGPLIFILIIFGSIASFILWKAGMFGYITQRSSKYKGSGIYGYELTIIYKGDQYYTWDYNKFQAIECNGCSKDSAYRVLENAADSFITDLRNHKCK